MIKKNKFFNEILIVMMMIKKQQVKYLKEEVMIYEREY
jgi:hypothetical protein